MIFRPGWGNVQHGAQVTQPFSGAAGSWWLAGGIDAANCAAAYQAKGAASYAASKVNLNTPGTQDAIDGAAIPTWDTAIGWTFAAASSQYLLAGTLKPATDQTWSAIVRYSGITGGQYLFGKANGVNRYFLIDPDVGVTVQYGNGAVVSVGPTLLSGNLCIAGAQGYRNGVADGGAIGAWGGTSLGLGIGIGCVTSAAASGYISGNIQAIAFYKTVALTAPQVAALTAAMAAL